MPLPVLDDLRVALEAHVDVAVFSYQRKMRIAVSQKMTIYFEVFGSSSEVFSFDTLFLQNPLVQTCTDSHRTSMHGEQ